MMKKHPIRLLAALVLAVSMLAAWIAGNPQIQRSEADEFDLLSMLFGESRTIIGQRMYYMADVYFHGGLHHEDEDEDEDDHDDHHGHHDDHDDHDEDEDDDDDDHYNDDRHHGHGQPNDLWSRLNRRLKPQEHRHLHGQREEKEILPWLWAAIRVDPHNVQAYLDGAYFLASRLDQPAEGLQLLAKGIENNPDHIELYFTKGTLLYNEAELTAAFEMLERGRQKWLQQWQESQPFDTPGAPSPPSTLLYFRILNYLAYIGIAQDNPARAIDFFNEAIPFAPNEDMRSRLVERIKELQLQQ